MKIAYKQTERGFLRVLFTDRYGEVCSLQESSLASEPAIWLGFDGPAGQRMHLTQEQMRELLPLLTRFVETGNLSTRSEAAHLSDPLFGQPKRRRDLLRSLFADACPACGGRTRYEGDGFVCPRCGP